MLGIISKRSRRVVLWVIVAYIIAVFIHQVEVEDSLFVSISLSLFHFLRVLGHFQWTVHVAFDTFHAYLFWLLSISKDYTDWVDTRIVHIECWAKFKFLQVELSRSKSAQVLVLRPLEMISFLVLCGLFVAPNWHVLKFMNHLTTTKLHPGFSLFYPRSRARLLEISTAWLFNRILRSFLGIVKPINAFIWIATAHFY